MDGVEVGVEVLVGVLEGVQVRVGVKVGVGVGVKGSRPKLTETVSPAFTATALTVLTVVLVKPAGIDSTNW